MIFFQFIALSLIIFSPCIKAQTLAETQVEMVTFEDPDLDDDTMTMVMMQIAATAEPGETWIPLGNFKTGALHRILIGSGGSGGHCSAVCEFSTTWMADKPIVHRLDQVNFQRRFRLYSYPLGSRQGVVLKYINVGSSTNPVKITYQTSDSAKWISDTPTLEFCTSLTDDDLMVAGIEQHSGGTYETEGLYPGIYLNQKATLNEGAIVKGELIIEEAQGDISMGAFGE